MGTGAVKFIDAGEESIIKACLQIVSMNYSDAEDAEAYYQALKAADEEALIADYSLRYGNDYQQLLDKYRGIPYLDEEEKGDKLRSLEASFPALESLVKHRLAELNVPSDVLGLLWHYMKTQASEVNLRIQLLMARRDCSLTDLMRAGVLMHASRDLLFIPDYLIQFLMSIPAPRPIRAGDTLAKYMDSPLDMALIELAAWGIHPNRAFMTAMYGVDPLKGLDAEFVGDIARLGANDEAVLNPLLDPMELRREIMKIKDSRGRELRRRIGLHGEYTFNKSIRCGAVYMLFSESRRGIMFLCPWLTVFNKLINTYVGTPKLVVLDMPYRPEAGEFYRKRLAGNYGLRNVAFAFMDGNEVTVLRPRGNFFEELIDVLYEGNFSVTEE